MSEKIYITQIDKIRLMDMIDEAVNDAKKKDNSVVVLENEINRAEVVNARQFPRNVISMNSRVLLHLGEDDEMEFQLVYPHEANLSENKLSVLSPVGTAILGYSEGDSIEWKVPHGASTIQVKKILYQPEAAGDYHL